MHEQGVIFSIFMIFAGAAVLATLALWARQAMIVAYIVAGVLLGPSGLGLVHDQRWIEDVSSIGIMFLLYLLGLNMEPQQLWRMLGEALGVTLASAAVFCALGALVGFAAGLGWHEALLVGGCMMFSSTIIGLKLLPTTTLHHQHTGQMMISVLLLQDLVAIVVLLIVQGYGSGVDPLAGIARQALALPLLVGVAFVVEKGVVERLMARYDQIQEYLFLLVIGWCLSIAQLAAWCGLSHEIGAFVAGVTLASCPVAAFIADSLRPLRDFFLVLFFFSLGAGFDFALAREVLLPALVLAGAMLGLKPYVFRWLFVRAGERARQSLEVGVRLGQVSEFSLLVAVVAVEAGILRASAGYLVQLTTLVSFVLSSYVIVMRYPTPIAVRDSLRRD
ncbi:MAG: cation:proton antiporter [Gammaproteobacteria bacterium]|nr:cation:proton antiporter [Gammaproteobacteria bacterium]